jgi:hypothetical protein
MLILGIYIEGLKLSISLIILVYKGFLIVVYTRIIKA